MTSLAIIVLQGFGSEAPRESLIAMAIWVFGLIVGALLARRHLVKPAEQRHEEVMEAHKELHDHFEIGK